MTHYHPYRHLLSMLHIDLRWTRCDVELDGALGWWYPERQEIVLDARMTQAERRSTLAHELVHAEQGDRPTATGVLSARQEARASRIASCRLVTLDQLAEALLWSQDESELAAALWVDVETVQARLAALTRAEHRKLDKMIRDAEGLMPDEW